TSFAAAIDPHGNGARVLTFIVNPYGGASSIDSRDRGAAVPWSTSKPTRTRDGWDVSMSIPLSSLGISNQQSDVKLRMNLTRNIGVLHQVHSLTTDANLRSLAAPESWPTFRLETAGPTAAALSEQSPTPLPVPSPTILLSQFVKAGPPSDELASQTDATGQQPGRSSVDIVYPFVMSGARYALQLAYRPDASNFQADQGTIAPDIAFPDDKCFPGADTECRFFFANQHTDFGRPTAQAPLSNPNGAAIEPMHLGEPVFQAPTNVFRLKDALFTSTIGIFDYGVKLSRISADDSHRLVAMGFGGRDVLRTRAGPRRSTTIRSPTPHRSSAPYRRPCWLTVSSTAAVTSVFRTSRRRST
ncbi:MAG: hypothetical protein M3N13_08895, partial [Candidatus Eremiobacteraeota bacterium]|nr:hypothetical protein [Candidatus Eremiobacteraeota bacterium]